MWRETERFSSSLSVIFIFTIAAVSLIIGVSLYPAMAGITHQEKTATNPGIT